MLLTRPLLSRELVGREQELEQLRQAQQRAASGYPQFVLLSGEAGIGKTRLCRTLVQTSVEPALRFWGRAHPQNQTIPFGPFLDAFRRSVDTLIHSLERLDQTLR